MAPSVSIVIPSYGNEHLARLDLITQSILSQRGVDIELIITGLNEARTVHNPRELYKYPGESSLEIVRNGEIINRGLRLARGDFTYITDADILLPNCNYLGSLVKKSNNLKTSLKRPPMRRLLLQDFDWFEPIVNSIGLDKAIKSLDKSLKYIVKPSLTERKIRVFPKFENGRHKVFIASESDFQEYVSDEGNKGSEPRYFNQDRHCGAVFALTDALERVGGYHEGFISWGVWDADVQWKLENITGMNLIPDEEEFDVIHLDHERGYFSKSKWEHDKELQKKRRQCGFEECIKEDIKIYFGGKNVKESI